MSSPKKNILPRVGSNWPLIRLIRVVLPAPFGPMIAQALPLRHFEGDVFENLNAPEVHRQISRP